MMNLLFGGVCMLIPIIGPIVLLGWLITGFWARQENDFETFPEFDFSNFTKYLERGLWPLLVVLVVSFVMVPLIWILMIPMMLISGFCFGHDPSASSYFAAIAMMLMTLALTVILFAMMLVLVPLKIRASLVQDFAKSFDFSFVQQFLALTWKEIVLSSLFVMITSALFFCIGMIVFCVGIYFAAVLNCFSWTHLQKQLYTLYLARGGESVPLSPKLSHAPGGEAMSLGSSIDAGR